MNGSSGQVNLNPIVELAGKWYGIRFTDGDETFPLVGRITNVKADDQWRQAEVDLLSAVNRAHAGTTIVSRLFFADSGIMNNLQDIVWHIDNFRFVPALPVGQSNAIAWRARDLSGIESYSWAFDNDPDAMPDDIVEGDDSFAIPQGVSYFHVRAKDKAGNWGPSAHFRFAALPPSMASAPAIAAPKPDDRATISSPDVEVELANASQIDVATIRWIASSAERKQEYTVSQALTSSLSFDPARGTLRWRDSTWTPESGKSYSLDCELAASKLSGAAMVEGRWKWTVDPSRDKMPPVTPYISYQPEKALHRVDFEAGLPEDFGLRRAAWVLLDDAAAATGTASARVVNLEGNDFFSAFLRKTPYSVDLYPRLAFDYRFDRSGCNLNLVSVVNGDMQIIEFAGQNRYYPIFRQNTIGSIPGVLQDGQWHHVDIDFGALLAKRYPDTPRFFADYLGTWATGSHTAYQNPQGASLWLDNVTLYSPQATSAGFEWNAPDDANGISGYSFVLDQELTAAPDETVDTTDTHCRFENLKPGTHYFHLRARDRAGNWGATSHATINLKED